MEDITNKYNLLKKEKNIGEENQIKNGEEIKENKKKILIEKEKKEKESIKNNSKKEGEINGGIGKKMGENAIDEKNEDNN